MDAFIKMLVMVRNLSWILESPPHIEPVLHARGVLDPLLSEEWSRLTIAACAVLVTSLIALGVYYIFIKPAAHIMRWLAWLAFVVGLPAAAGYLVWIVPTKV